MPLGSTAVGRRRRKWDWPGEEAELWGAPWSLSQCNREAAELKGPVRISPHWMEMAGPLDPLLYQPLDMGSPRTALTLGEATLFSWDKLERAGSWILSADRTSSSWSSKTFEEECLGLSHRLGGKWHHSVVSIFLSFILRELELVFLS